MRGVKINPKILRPIGLLLFSVGIFLGLALSGIAAWADLEASFYFGYEPTDKPLNTLTCPKILTRAESGTVTVSLNNPTQGAITPVVDIDISNHGAMRTLRTKPSIAPNETQRLQWTVTADDIVFGYLILAKVAVSHAATLPSRLGTCGTLVIDLPGLTGNQIFTIALAISLLGILIGTWIWTGSNRPLNGRGLDATRAMVVLAVIVLAGMLFSFMGWWMLGIIMFSIAVLLIFTVIAYLIQSP
jgi:hypothetical protein